MWFALSIPLVVMVVAVLMERLERRYMPEPDLAESTVDLAVGTEPKALP